MTMEDDPYYHNYIQTTYTFELSSDRGKMVGRGGFTWGPWKDITITMAHIKSMLCRRGTLKANQEGTSDFVWIDDESNPSGPRPGTIYKPRKE